IFTKILTTRMQPILMEIISQQQSGFIQGRIIQDGIIMVHETIHSMDKSKKAGMAIKLDMHKAFDRVSWRFMDEVLS
ncbi:hypothetical protein KI387_044680, partial [Taxus chinensis]